jgi:hypothetical protein
MKYFTPERYLRLGDLEHEKSFLAAHEEWETAVAGYGEHLRKIHEDLPTGLRRLIESVYLHDARVLDIWQGPVSRLSITLQPESDRGHLAVLHYSLVQPPSIKTGILPALACSEPTAWLYDELDAVKPASNGRKRRQNAITKVFIHDILLSNGWEIELLFRDVTVSRPVPLIPHVPHLHGARAVPPFPE